MSREAQGLTHIGEDQWMKRGNHLSAQALTGRTRFAAVRAGRCQAEVGVLRVRVAFNQAQCTRVGFALPQMKGAVMRNRIRRRLRAAIVELELDREFDRGFDVVVLARPAAATLRFADLVRDLGAAIGAATLTAGSMEPPAHVPR